MRSSLLGLILALAAASLYSIAVSLQAFEARGVPARHTLRPSLLRRLVRRPLWVAGAALGILGWAMQAAALTYAPLTLVEPTMATSLVFILAAGAYMLRQSLLRREMMAIAAVAIGVAALGVAAPAHRTLHAGGPKAGGILAGLCLIAAAPHLGRHMRPPVGLIAAGAGVAYGLVAITTKFAADDIATHAWRGLAGWLALLLLTGTAGLLSEMSALQTQPVRRVAPIVFGLNVLVPVLAAPTLAHEPWNAASTVRLTLLLSVVTIAAGVAVLSRSPRVDAILAGHTATS